MSATLNSEQFQKYFAVHKKSGLIIEPEVVIKHQKVELKSRRGTRDTERKRGNVDWNTIDEPKK
jgi:hypothetical protein